MSQTQNQNQSRYQKDNIFAKMLAGEIPCHKIFEDDKTLAFMDIMPQARGHVLIIPKQDATDLSELAPEFAAAVLMTAKKVMKAQQKVLNREGIIQMQLNGAEAGQSVFHYHIHLVPANIHDLGRHATEMADNEELTALAKELATAIERAPTA